MANGKPVVAFLGPEGSYTHQATLKRFPSAEFTLSPQRTIADAVAAIPSGSARFSVVPFENSTNGSVVATLDLLAASSTLSSSPTSIPDPKSTVSPGVRVCGEIYLPVHHALSASTSLPSLDAVTKLYSHPQAWGQCARYLGTERWKRVEKQDVSSTSRGTELVAAEGPDSRSAAISSAVAAERSGLRVWVDGIEDVRGNCTRFLVLESSGPAVVAAAAVRTEGAREHAEGEKREVDDERFKTLVLFVVSHAEPGALADSLAVFKRFGLNLTSINTRPSGHVSWNYVFFVEFIGRKWTGEINGRVNQALQELARVAKGWRWMGSWENQLLVDSS